MLNITLYTYEATLKTTLLPIYITYKTLTYNELLSCNNQSIINGIFNKNYYKYLVVKTSVLRKDRKYIDELNEKDYNKLFDLILEKSRIQDNLPEILEKVFEIFSDKNLQNDTWDCEVCKQKKLQYNRNCPLIDVKNNDFFYTIKGKIFKSCPIGETLQYKDIYNNAILAYNLYKKGILPNKGGFYDQTEFFVISSRVIDNLITKYESEELEKLNTS